MPLCGTFVGCVDKLHVSSGPRVSRASQLDLFVDHTIEHEGRVSSDSILTRSPNTY